MANYADKYVLSSGRYSGRTYYHDTIDEAKAHYDALMADPDFMSFDTDDVVYSIYPAVVITPSA